MTSALSRAARRLSKLGTQLFSPAPVRPIVVFQSDDWGRVGLPSLAALDRLKAQGLPIGNSPWDYYGLETEADVLALGETLGAFRDGDGVSPCFVANFILANADLRRMCEEGFRTLRTIAIKDGFPQPWQESRLLGAYRRNIERKVFHPALHGFTHFNTGQFLASLSEQSPRGDRIRTLVMHDIPYLASLTPELNFALVNRTKGEHFLPEADQWNWLRQGMALFAETFGVPPRSTCAPGYRANDTTFRLWNRLGLRVAQTVGDGALTTSEGLLVLQRNAFFEPALSEGDVVKVALAAARSAVRSGYPIVICSHSINYLSRFCARSGPSLEHLRTLILGLLKDFPDLRFATDTDVLEAFEGRKAGWLKAPSLHHILHRFRRLAGSLIFVEAAARQQKG